MLSYKDEIRVERWFAEAETALLQGGTLGAPGDRLREFLAEHDATTIAVHRLGELAALVGLPADALAERSYVGRWGFGGIRRHATGDGRALLQIDIRTFPGHDTACYLLPGDEMTLIDIGSGLPSTRDDWEDRVRTLAAVFGIDHLRQRVRHLVISHGHVDHYGALAALLQIARPLVYCHELDARVLEQFDERLVLAAEDLRRYLRTAGMRDERVGQLLELFTAGRTTFHNVPVDVRLRDGAVIPGGGEVIHTPGHCAGLICIRFGDVLYTADHVLQHVTPHQTPQALNPFFGLENYFASLRRVGELQGIRVGLTSHGPAIPDVAARVQEIMYFHQRRLWQVLELCEEPQTVADVSRALFGNLSGYNVILGIEEAGAHVEYLHQHGWLRVANLAAVERGETSVIQYRRDPEALKRRKEPSVFADSPRAS